jgi:hypothetical protein
MLDGARAAAERPELGGPSCGSVVRSGPGSQADSYYEENAVPTIIAHHDVDDPEHWLASPKRAEFFGTLGITSIRTFTNPANPAQVALLLDVPDVDALVEALGTENAAATMKHDGVRPETMVLLIET